MKKPIALLLAMTSYAVATASYITLTDSLTNSAIYPGTVHTFQVTVPDSYDPDDPAALYLGLDGILCDAPAVIDSLTATHVIPPTIGVYLQPGIVRDSRGRIVRYNRSNEFDATDSRFAEFLATELLPAVERMALPDHRPIRLSARPSERVIFGLSSGGIAAFTAAWHRPDLFGKVFSGCGTFVPMRGGNNLQAIIRKHEPLPLRIFLQDGFDDCWNPIFGSWFEANATLGTALRFAGYDLRTDWAEGTHSVRRATEILPEVLTWLWRDGHADITVRDTGNPQLATLLVPGEGWKKSQASKPARQKVARRRPNQPYAIYPDSSLMAQTAEGTNYISQYIIGPDGNPIFGQPFYWLHTYDNSRLTIGSMEFDGNGDLWVVTNAGIQICDQNGRVRCIVRLPGDIDVSSAKIEIAHGAVILTGYDTNGKPASYRRRLNTTPATPGQRPASQGQA